jgi:hypothetical protein
MYLLTCGRRKTGAHKLGGPPSGRDARAAWDGSMARSVSGILAQKQGEVTSGLAVNISAT